MSEFVPNLYVHFPFCRYKCTYCALKSSAKQPLRARENYVFSLACALRRLGAEKISHLKTIYFGGGSPALCDLTPLFKLLTPAIEKGCEFSIELHPLDVNENMLQNLRTGGITRVSMGVQSMNDKVLEHMNRHYTMLQASRAFEKIKNTFENAGIDLIVGYPNDEFCFEKIPTYFSALTHCSIYSLILEENTALSKLAKKRNLNFPTDDDTLNLISNASAFLESIGLLRYEISNYATPGFECQHNLSVWRGEDYYGLGNGAYGRVALNRTIDDWFENSSENYSTVSKEADFVERKIFALRTRYGLNAEDRKDWCDALEHFAEKGLVDASKRPLYRLTKRGTEVCDSILAELI